jgi:hypothetical protein
MRFLKKDLAKKKSTLLAYKGGNPKKKPSIFVIN